MAGAAGRGRGGGEGSAEAGLELGPIWGLLGDSDTGAFKIWAESATVESFARLASPRLASLGAGAWRLYAARAAHVRGREPLFGVKAETELDRAYMLRHLRPPN